MTTNEFLEKYFQWDGESGAGSLSKMLAEIALLNWDVVQIQISKMSYFDFLKSLYWRIISDEVKRQADYKCSCGCRSELQVHHTKEAVHGSEHMLKGLVCLCRKCHASTHKELVDTKEAERKRKREQQKASLLSQIPIYPHSVNENDLSGSSAPVIQHYLTELENERKIFIERNIYEGNRISLL